MPRERLHEEERRARVDGVEPVPQRDVGVNQRAAIGRAAALTSASTWPKPLQRRCEDTRRRVGIGEISGEEAAFGAERGDFLGGARALRRIAADDEHAARARVGGALGDREADALRPAGDDDDLSLQTVLPRQRLGAALASGDEVLDQNFRLSNSGKPGG